MCSAEHKNTSDSNQIQFDSRSLSNLPKIHRVPHTETNQFIFMQHIQDNFSESYFSESEKTTRTKCLCINKYNSAQTARISLSSSSTFKLKTIWDILKNNPVITVTGFALSFVSIVACGWHCRFPNNMYCSIDARHWLDTIFTLWKPLLWMLFSHRLGRGGGGGIRTKHFYMEDSFHRNAISEYTWSHSKVSKQRSLCSNHKRRWDTALRRPTLSTRGSQTTPFIKGLQVGDKELFVFTLLCTRWNVHKIH